MPAFNQCMQRMDQLSQTSNYAACITEAIKSVKDHEIRLFYIKELKRIAEANIIQIYIQVATDSLNDHPRLNISESPRFSENSGESDSVEYNFNDTLYTSKGNEIDIYIPKNGKKSSTVSEQDEAKYLNDMNIVNKVRKISPADPRYNCHGYTFANRRGWITEGREVSDILQYNRFVSTEHPQIGDIVIYSKKREITHSGVVISFNSNSTPIIESKLGKYGVYQHYANTLCQEYGNFQYYHTNALCELFSREPSLSSAGEASPGAN